MRCNRESCCVALVFSSDTQCIQKAVTMECNMMCSCSGVKSGGSDVSLYWMISAAREFGRLSKEKRIGVTLLVTP